REIRASLNREKNMTKYAYRLETRRVRESDFPYTGKGFTHPEAVAEFCRSLRDLDVERMIVLHLSTKNNLIGVQFFSGTIDRDVIHTREVIKEALLAGGTGLILVHNHPSGHSEASLEDRALTQAIISCAKLFDIRVLDHIILGENSFFSAKSAGWF
ncbi:MAG: hypothetical protein L7F78_16050, partial [Syntrophales bacterium LBB04]|nr:hypothetical protein [Syntrophales bacterium LBB04]